MNYKPSLILLPLALLFAACQSAPFSDPNGPDIAGGLPQNAPASAPAPANVTISIDNFTFSPAAITIAPGTTVTWINHDDIPHTATAASSPPIFNSGALDTDQKFSFTFQSPGAYSYFCKIHPHMTATITVTK